MRLIDADKLKVLVAVENNGVINTGKLITELFDEMETVEAIPIEWIYLWRLKNMDKCPVDYIPFSALLNDWEKENATD